ncbi:hypothetical protein D3C84_1168640 [compost metagenome]
MQQVHRNGADLNGQRFHIHLPSADRHFNKDWPFFGIPYKLNGVDASLQIDIGVPVLLRAALVNVLLEITFLIK